MKTILVTGGAGYIGSHTCIELMKGGYDVIILDNLANCRFSVLGRLESLCGHGIEFIEADIRDAAALDKVFAEHDVWSVIHFAGLKAVGESVTEPLSYYANNVSGTITLLSVMRSHGVRNLVFSSSATVYGDPHSVPISEDFPLQPTNPYGRSKLMVEDILRDLAASDPEWRVAILRYFNPVGAHESGILGEDPRGIPNNLLPYVSRVAAGTLPRLAVFGCDYPTTDGTGVRDYIHVVDLAQGHVAALRYLERSRGPVTVNLGTGHGHSVFEIVRAFEKASSHAIPYEVAARRPGDVAACYADPSRATAMLGWQPKRNVDDMCADAWRWQQWATANLPE